MPSSMRVAATAGQLACNCSKLTEKTVFNVAFGSSVSIRFRSCENRFVTTPVSVLVKKDSGA
jgi:hypothetical protein